MKILCVSDTVLPQLENAVNLRRRYSDIELLISCGDMPAVYLDYIASVLSVPLFYVRGNHDESYEQDPPGGENLHMRLVKYGGLTFTGIEGSIRYNRGTVQYTDAEVLNMTVRMGTRLMIPKLRRGCGVDVLVTHSPAYGIHDREDKPHHGFKGLLRFMEWYRPRYMLHGHVHTYDRRDIVETNYLDTCVMNINPSTIVEIEPVSE